MLAGPIGLDLRNAPLISLDIPEGIKHLHPDRTFHHTKAARKDRPPMDTNVLPDDLRAGDTENLHGSHRHRFSLPPY